MTAGGIRTSDLPHRRHRSLSVSHHEATAEMVHGSRAVHRLYSVGGAVPVNFGRRRRRATGPNKSAAAAARRGVGGQNCCSKIPEKFRSILEIL